MDEYQSSFPPRSDKYNKNRRNKNKQTTTKKSFKEEFFSTVFYIMMFSGLFFMVHRYLFAPVMVDGNSMEPTLSNGDYLILNKVSQIDRFDIIVFPPPEEDEEMLYIKRVIGVPGDTVEYDDDTLYINGEEIDEYFLDFSQAEEDYYSSGNFTLTTLLGDEEVPEGHYFVLGDNRLNSRDSRSFGFIEQESILGKISLRYWPVKDAEVIKNEKK